MVSLRTYGGWKHLGIFWKFGRWSRAQSSIETQRMIRLAMAA